MPLECLAWNSPPLDFSRISVTMLINIITIIIILTMMVIIIMII